MSVSIHTCPECDGLLLGDSPACPHCGHVLDPHKAEQVPQPIRQAPVSKDEPEKACPLCGEKVRPGLVRCWQCGTFMNSEMENYYQQMQASPSPVIYSLDPDQLMKPAAASQSSSEDDYELKYELLRDAEEAPAEEYQLSSSPTDAPSDSDAADEAGFTLGANSMMFIPTYEEPEPTIAENEYQLTQSSMLQLNLPAEGSATEAPAAAAPEPAPPPATLPVPEGWDPEQYYQYLRDAMDWYKQLDDSQKGEYAASVMEQTGLQFPPENLYLLYGEPAPEPEASAPAEEAAPTAESSPAAEAASTGSETPASPEEHHSVATGGDVLLSAALQEQLDQLRRPRGTKLADPNKSSTPGTFIVHCPTGHRIQVKDKHRGQTGRCPVCKSLFHVPAGPAVDPAVAAAAAAEAALQANLAALAPGGYELWLQDLRLHLVQLTKLKLKAGSLQQEYETVDLGFGPEGLLVATVFKGGGSFRAAAEKKKKPESRAALKDHLRSGAALSESPLPRTTLIGLADLPQIRVVQPASPDEESVFADVPVFGAGMIAVRIPAPAEGGAKQYISMTLTEFRDLSRMLTEQYQLPPLGEGLGIPMEDQFAEVKCAFTETRVSHIAGPLDYYKADPKRPLVPVAWKCAGCGIYISQPGAKKEKLGGKNASGIAKAKCPKCKKKIGPETLMGFPPESADAAKTK